MAAPRINRIEFDRHDGLTVETDGHTVELLPYSVWREDGDELPDTTRDQQTCVIRLGRWVLCATPRR